MVAVPDSSGCFLRGAVLAWFDIWICFGLAGTLALGMGTRRFSGDSGCSSLDSFQVRIYLGISSLSDLLRLRNFYLLATFFSLYPFL